MAYSKAVENFAKEIYEGARDNRSWLPWAELTEMIKDDFRMVACKLMQNGWQKQASRDTTPISWEDVQAYKELQRLQKEAQA